MFFILKFIINIFLSIMSLIGAFFIFQKILYLGSNFFLLIKLVLLVFFAIYFFVIAILYLKENKNKS